MNAGDRARLVQLEAADPGRSVVLRAAAGSGKTTVLVDRFLRLCLEDTPARTAPGTILAVTFTRKAAVEIQERLRREARALALAAPADRARLLRRLFGDREGREPVASELAAAGALYEQLLVDTAALQLGTIHSFCQVVLGRFAREAGLDPAFGVLERPEELHDEAFDLLVGEIAREPVLASAARRLGAHPDNLRRKLQACLDESMRLRRWLAFVGASAPGARTARAPALPELEADLRRRLFPALTDPDVDPAPALVRALAAAVAIFANGLPDVVAADLGALPDKQQASLDKLVAAAAALAERLAAAGGGAADDANTMVPSALADEVRTLLLTKEGATRSYTLAGGAAAKVAFNTLVAARARPVLAALQELERLELLRDNVALLRLGLRLLDLADELKRRDRVVDFQDLEDLASGLLADPERALELQYRLDDAIQHLLVDEFQDTNVNQWDLLRPFVEEFRAGGGDRVRTYFLVGDVKQSIYGFRGAWPQLFLDIAERMREYGGDLLELPTNFRSRRAIVAGVGELFNVPPLAGRLEVAEQDGVRQAWARDDAPGTFIVHAPFPDPDEPERPGAGGGELAAARAAAALIRRLHDDGEPVHDPRSRIDRPLHWRDVLVLARTRTAFGMYERAFRDAGIPFVPPGRGMLAASREVQDVLALLRWLAWPDDNVALATLLRSPIVRLDHATFQSLLSRRGVLERDADGRWREPPRTLWQVVREATEPRVAAAGAILADWRRKLDFEPCHDLLRRIAREAELPHRYQLALGEQARFNLERLFDLALGREVLGTPTARRLAEVIARAAGQGTQEEAPLPSDGEGRVRFLTVHGAKGLEAPVVLLVDADRKPSQRGAHVHLEGDGGEPALLLNTKAAQRRGYVLPPGVEPLPDPLAAAVAEADARNRTERAHLLYVALTRARDRLHVLGGDQDRGGPKEHESPLRDLREAAAQVAAAAVAAGTEAPVLAPDAAGDPLHAPDETAPATGSSLSPAPLPSPLTWRPPVRRPRYALVRPSAAADDPRDDRREPGEADDESGSPSSSASLPPGVSPAAHGDRVHRLLQAACDAGAVPDGDGAAHVEASAVFATTSLSWVFRAPADGAAWSEVPVAARRSGVGGASGAAACEQRIIGIIDRLVVRPDRVDIIDFKTNRGVADAARRAWLLDHYRPQLDAYREVLARLHPERPIRAWLLFTDPALAHGERLHEIG